MQGSPNLRAELALCPCNCQALNVTLIFACLDASVSYLKSEDYYTFIPPPPISTHEKTLRLRLPILARKKREERDPVPPAQDPALRLPILVLFLGNQTAETPRFTDPKQSSQSARPREDLPPQPMERRGAPGLLRHQRAAPSSPRAAVLQGRHNEQRPAESKPFSPANSAAVRTSSSFSPSKRLGATADPAEPACRLKPPANAALAIWRQTVDPPCLGACHWQQPLPDATQLSQPNPQLGMAK